jgi:glycogen debranching enzyme
MSNAPHDYAIVVGRDTGWMGVGTDAVAPWFAPEALRAFRERQKPNGQILEWIDMETGQVDDYGLNASDNTPLYLWAVVHHWHQYGEAGFRTAYLESARRAADHLIEETGPDGLIVTRAAGTGPRGTTSWRNIIDGYVLAGEVTEINALSAMALRMAGEFTGEAKYGKAGDRMADAVEDRLWTGECYRLTRTDGKPNDQVTGDAVFPLICGVAGPAHARKVLERLGQGDFWTPRGMRTIPNSDPGYHPNRDWGLLGGSWPNLTLWYAAAVARQDPDLALKALEIVARPVVEAQDPAMNVNHTEFPEWFDGDSGVSRGMRLSPWVAPTFVWAVLEGLMGLAWSGGRASFAPVWPSGWTSMSVTNLPSGSGPVDRRLTRSSPPGA